MKQPAKIAYKRAIAPYIYIYILRSTPTFSSGIKGNIRSQNRDFTNKLTLIWMRVSLGISHIRREGLWD